MAAVAVALPLPAAGEKSCALSTLSRVGGAREPLHRNASGTICTICLHGG